MTNIEENMTLSIENSNFLKKPLGRYFNSGSVGEKIFEEYCKKNNINFVRPLYMMWAIYGIFLKEKGRLSKRSENAVKRYGVKEIVGLMSKKQINFLKKEFIEKSESNFDVTGMPDYIIWKGNSLTMVEIKSGNSFLRKKQEEVIEKLKDYFEVRVYNVRFDIKVEKISIGNIKIEEL